MRRIAILSILLATTIHSSGQSVTFKDLKGIWKSNNTQDIVHRVFFNFVSATKVIQVDIVKGDDPYTEQTVYTYQLDNVSSPTLITLTEQSSRPGKLKYYFMVKIENGVLKLQGDLDGKKIVQRKWNTPTLDNTGFFVRTTGISF